MVSKNMDHRSIVIVSEIPEEERLSDENQEIHGRPVQPDLTKQKICWGSVLKASVLLLAPFIFGMMIVQMGNFNQLRTVFVEQSALSISNKTYNNTVTLGGFYPTGGVIGAITSAKAVEAYGRRKTTVVIIILMLVGNIVGLIGIYVNFFLFIVCRFLVGVASAGIIVTAVIWLLEILPVRLQNTFKPMIQTLINVGIVVGSTLNLDAIIAAFPPIICLLPAVASLILLVVCIYIPESVKWLLMKDASRDQIVPIMQELRGQGYSEEELIYLEDVAKDELKESRMSMTQFLKNKRYTRAIMASVFMHVSQQFSGINAVVAFTQEVLTGVPRVDLFCLLVIVINLVFSIITCLVSANFRRKLFLVLGHAIMALGYLVFIIVDSTVTSDQPSTAVNIGKIVALCIVALGFQMGPGPLVWFVTMEIFPLSAVGAAQGLCSSTNWIANAVIFFTFPVLSRNMKPKMVLVIFLIINVVIVIVGTIFIEETKDREPADILASYNKSNRIYNGDNSETPAI